MILFTGPGAAPEFVKELLKMIPHIIHQIWIGNKEQPTDCMDSWRNKNPDFEYRIWREKDLEKLFIGTKNFDIYKKFYKLKIFHGAADVARVEIIKKFGGVYVDADSIALEPIGSASFMADKINFFAALDHENKKFPGRITNGVIGAIPFHPIMIDYSLKIPRERMSVEPWKTVGGKLLTECVKRYGKDPGLVILPAYTFWPENWDGTKITPEGKVYAKQMWRSSPRIYN